MKRREYEKIKSTENEKKEMQVSELETEAGQDRPSLVFDKIAENLIEIAFVFAGMQSKYEKLSDIDSIWKQEFVDWADEFRAVHAGTDWNQDDYKQEIESYARKKILTYAGLED